MDETTSRKVMSFKDLNGKQDISFSGVGQFSIGLSLNGSLSVGRDEDDLCMTLLQLQVHDNGGYTLAAVNKDLKCIVNSTAEMAGEINLVDGTKLEVGDKTLVFIDGPIPKRRRKLPPTPGIALTESTPPAKPTRTWNLAQPCDQPSKEDAHADEEIEGDTDKRWLENSCCMQELSTADQEQLHDFDTPEQISILAASYFTKQLRMFTDANVTTKLLDEIFKMFADSVHHCKDTYLHYLSSVSKMIARAPHKSQKIPMHGPAVKLLTELLKHCLDHVKRVTLIIDLIRTFSHFDRNLVTMVRCQSTAAILGSMSVYVDTVDVQQYAMDILAKLATYTPSLDKKAPLKEACIDVIIRGMKHHSQNVAILRSACRVFSNISSTLINALNSWLETETPQETLVVENIQRYETILVYTFQEGMLMVQTVLKDFSADLGVRTEGRRFIYYYAKLPQLQQKISKRLMSMEETVEVEIETSCTTELAIHSCDSQTQHPRSPTLSQPTIVVQSQPLSQEIPPQSAVDTLSVVMTDDDTPGILKNARSYENLKTCERRLSFADGTFGGSDSNSYTSDSDDGASSPLVNNLVPISVKEDFSSNLVEHLMKKTLKRKRRTVKLKEQADSDSDSDWEILESIAIDNTNLEDLDIETKVKNNDQENNSLENNVPVDMSSNHNDEEITLQRSKQSRSTVRDKIKAFEQTGKLIDYRKNNSERKGNEFAFAVVNNSESQDPYGDNGESDLNNDNNNKKDAGQATAEHIDQQEEYVMKLTDIDQIDFDADKISETSVNDVYFFGKLLRTQVIIYVGSLVFKDEDSKVLLVIDQPINTLLEDAAAPSGVKEFAGKQYGANMTLMDLDPAIVINIIDAVRYRSVTKELVQSSVLSLTRGLTPTLHQTTISTTMQLYKTLFTDINLNTIVTEKEFLEEFRTCFRNATDGLSMSDSIEEIRKHMPSPSFVI